MLEIKWTKPVKKDLKKYKHQKDVIGALQEIILLLVNKKPLPTVNLDHPLTGNWVNYRECSVFSLKKFDTCNLSGCNILTN